MGNWYANISLKCVNQMSVVERLREYRRRAFVSQAYGQYVVIYDSECRRMDGDDSERLAARLTADFQCTAVIALNADDDELWLCVYTNGERIGEYLSSTPSREGASMVARACGRAILTPALWLVLQGPFIFEVFRHLAVCRLLGLPGSICTYGYPGDDEGELDPAVPSGLFVASHHDE
jgi:hypothetical protein